MLEVWPPQPSLAAESKQKNFNDPRLFVFLYALLSIGVAACLISVNLLNFVYGSHLAFKHYFGLEKARAYYLDRIACLGAACLPSKTIGIH